MQRTFQESARDPYRLPPSKPANRTPNFREARIWLEWEVSKQLRIDAANGMSRALPIQLQDRWDRHEPTTPLSVLSPSEIDELAREIAEHHAREGTNRYYLDILPEAKRRRGEA